MAIEHGLTILSWYENHVSDDIPNENLWEDSEGLSEHWDKIREKQERKYSGKQGSEPVPQAGEEMGKNEYAAALRG